MVRRESRVYRDTIDVGSTPAVGSIEIWGIRAEALKAFVIIISTIVLYIVPIIGVAITGAVYLQNLHAAVEQIRKEQLDLRKTVNAVSFTALSTEVSRLRETVDQIATGSTIPQVSLRKDVDRILNDISDLNRRYNELHDEVDQRGVNRDSKRSLPQRR